MSLCSQVQLQMGTYQFHHNLHGWCYSRDSCQWCEACSWTDLCRTCHIWSQNWSYFCHCKGLSFTIPFPSHLASLMYKVVATSISVFFCVKFLGCPYHIMIYHLTILLLCNPIFNVSFNLTNKLVMPDKPYQGSGGIS